MRFFAHFYYFDAAAYDMKTSPPIVLFANNVIEIC